MTSFKLPMPAVRQRAISILPLINVVFLLLIFIVLSGVISAPDPFELKPVQSGLGEEAGDAGSEWTIYVSATGAMRLRDAQSEGEILALAQSLAGVEEAKTLTVRADAAAPATTIIRLVEGLRMSGLSGIELQAERKQ